ncbi:MAG: phage tail protein [Defluviitaleaceae bacterium]|nr:phage tail protein [Defluviitaleaceae bacterium]
MAFSANQTRLFHRSGGTTFVEIQHLMEVPELGSSPEKIDVTTLADTSKRYIPGIKDYGDLVFKFLYDNQAAGANYRILKGMEDTGNTVTFQLRYPDGATHTFDAIPAVSMDAGSINGALTFSVTMMMQGDVAVANPA